MASNVISTTIRLLGQLDPSVQSAMNAAENAAGSTGKKIGAAMVAGLAVIGVAVAATVKEITDIGDQYQQASGQIAAATGATGEKLTGLQDIMKNVYGDNFGEDMNDVANAISNVNQQMSGLSDIQLENVTEQAFMLRDTFEYDIPESVRAANAITKQFGTDAEYAMNLIATGAQNGLDYSGELLDTISEYSSQFAKIGFSADDMFQILQTGADTGAWNLDKIGDAVKEMSIRVVDGSDTTVGAFSSIGLNADEMAQKFVVGGESARNAFFETVSALANMDDKVQQNIAGVGIFGTMWEDLGPDVVLQLASIGDEAYTTGDAFEQINNIKYDNLSSALEGIKRKVDVALLPLGEKLASAGIKGLSKLSVIIEQASPYIEQFADVFSKKIGGAIGWLVPYVMPIFNTLTSGAQKFIPYATNVVNALAPVVDMLKPVIEALLPAVNNYLGSFVSIASTAAGIVSGALTAAIQFIVPYLQDVVNFAIDIIDKFSSFDSVVATIEQFAPAITGIATAIGIYMIATQGAAIATQAVAIATQAATIAQTIHNGVMALGTTVAGGFAAAMAAVNWPLLAIAATIGAVIAIGVALYQNWDWVQQKASELTAWLSAKWEEIKINVGSFIESIKASFSNGFSTLVSIVKAPFDKILGFINNIKGAVGDLIGKITGAKSEAATITVPKYAMGGTVTVPHLALVGDAPETIVPHGNTVHNQALLMEAAKGVFGSNIPEIESTSKIIDFPKIQDSFSSVSQMQQYKDNIISLPEIQLPEIQQYETLDDELQTPEDDFEYIDIGGSGGDTYNFNVVINIDGGSENIKNDMIEAEQEFERRIEQYLERKKRRQFA